MKVGCVSSDMRKGMLVFTPCSGLANLVLVSSVERWTTYPDPELDQRTDSLAPRHLERGSMAGELREHA